MDQRIHCVDGSKVVFTYRLSIDVPWQICGWVRGLCNTHQVCSFANLILLSRSLDVRPILWQVWKRTSKIVAYCDLKCDMAMFLKYWSYSFQFCEGMLFLSFSFSSWAFFGSLDFEPFLSYFDSLECPTEFLNQHTAISTRTHMERLQKKEEALDRCV